MNLPIFKKGLRVEGRRGEVREVEEERVEGRRGEVREVEEERTLNKENRRESKRK